MPSINATRAGPKLLAGFTEVPVSPIPKICTSVSVSPITRPPNDPWFAFAEVTPRIVRTKTNVRNASTINPAASVYARKTVRTKTAGHVCDFAK